VGRPGQAGLLRTFVLDAASDSPPAQQPLPHPPYENVQSGIARGGGFTNPAVTAWSKKGKSDP